MSGRNTTTLMHPTSGRQFVLPAKAARQASNSTIICSRRDFAFIDPEIKLVIVQTDALVVLHSKRVRAGRFATDMSIGRMGSRRRRIEISAG